MRGQRDGASGSHPQLDLRILEACRELSINIGGPDLETLAVTSAVPGEGRTTFALGVALVQSRDYRRRVVVLDLAGGVANPSLSDRLGGQRGPGLAELVSGDLSLGMVQQRVGENLTLISAGRLTDAAIAPIISAMRAGLLRELREGHDVVIADLPPLLGPGLAHLIVADFQRLVVVVGAGQTPIPRVQEALAHLPVEPALVLNRTQSKLPRWLQALTGA